MMFTDILLVLFLVGAILFGLDASRNREIACQFGKRACEKEGVQFLDDTVSLTRTRLRRNQQGRINIYREYQFEFSTDGGYRYAGELIVLGQQLQRITLEPYRAS